MSYHTKQGLLTVTGWRGVGKTFCGVCLFTVCTGLCAHVPRAPIHSEPMCSGSLPMSTFPMCPLAQCEPVEG